MNGMLARSLTLLIAMGCFEAACAQAVSGEGVYQALRVLPRRQSASENRRVEYLERTELGRDGVDREPTQPRGA